MLTGFHFEKPLLNRIASEDEKDGRMFQDQTVMFD